MIKLRIKKEYENRTHTFKTDDNRTIFFDGTINYDQNRLMKMYGSRIYNRYVEIYDTEDIEETKGKYDFEITYVNTLKQTPPDEKTKELKEELTNIYGDTLEEKLDVLGDALGDDKETTKKTTKKNIKVKKVKSPNINKK